MKLFITSDWHINHKNITGPSVSSWDRGYRDFSSTEEMNNVIIDNCNSIVSAEDFIIYGGDLLFGPDKLVNLEKLMNSLVCRNWIYIYGNHDEWMYKKQENKFAVQGILRCPMHHEYTFSYKGKNILIRHYSPEEWDVLNGELPAYESKNRHKNLNYVRDPDTIFLYGHEHHSDPSRKLDIGVDTDHNGHKKFMPYLLDDAIDIYLGESR